MFQLDLEVLFEFDWLYCSDLLAAYIWFMGSFCFDDLVVRGVFGKGHSGTMYSYFEELGL